MNNWETSLKRQSLQIQVSLHWTFAHQTHAEQLCLHLMHYVWEIVFLCCSETQNRTAPSQNSVSKQIWTVWTDTFCNKQCLFVTIFFSINLSLCGLNTCSELKAYGPKTGGGDLSSEEPLAGMKYRLGDETKRKKTAETDDVGRGKRLFSFGRVKVISAVWWTEVRPEREVLCVKHQKRRFLDQCWKLHPLYMSWSGTHPVHLIKGLINVESAGSEQGK